MFASLVRLPAAPESTGMVSLVREPGAANWSRPTTGATVSTVHVYVATAPLFWAASVWRTLNVWEPSASPEYDWLVAVSHGAYEPASSLQLIVPPASAAVKAKLAVVLLVGFGGFEAGVIVGANGATVSRMIVRSAPAGAASDAGA